MDKIFKINKWNNHLRIARKCLLKMKKFSDFYKFARGLKNKPKLMGTIFELFVFYLFQIDPELKNGLEKLWMWDDVPLSVLQKLNLPNKDKGIDLLAKINGQYVPIQVKFRSNKNTTISWTELGTFAGLAFAPNDETESAYFVTNTFELCDTLWNDENNCQKIKPIYGEYFENLDDNLFDNMHKLMNGDDNAIKYKPYVPRPYQWDCIWRCVLYFHMFFRGYIEMACGTGKTLQSYFVDKYMSNHTTLILVPSLNLLSQFYKSWINQSYAEGININYVLIGSDSDNDNIYVPKSHIKATINPFEIKRNIKRNNNKLVIICTYQSFNKLRLACPKLIFDFCIMDEAHKTVGEKNRKFSEAIHDKNIKKKLFMTATTKMSHSEEIIGMNNTKYYGDNIFTYNFGKAILNKQLTNYQIVSLATSNETIQQFIEDNNLVKFDNEDKKDRAHYVGTALMLLKEIKDGNIKHLVTYHRKIIHSKQFCQLLIEIHEILRNNDDEYDFDIYIHYMSGKTSMSNRNKIINEFKESKHAILCSARVLNEGVDIPIIDSVCFVDRRLSTIDIIQCIGRCLRLSKGKKISYVYVPTIIQDINNCDGSEYENILKIAKKMGCVDARLIEWIEIMVNGGKKSRKTKKMIDLKLDSEIELAEKINIGEWENKIFTKIWKHIDKTGYNENKFLKKFKTFKKWIDNNGRLPMKSKKNTEESKWELWCREIKRRYTNGELDKDQIKLFEQIDSWNWKLNEDWKTAVKDICLRVVNPMTKEFTFEDIHNHKKELIKRTGTSKSSKTHKATMYRNLQYLRYDGLLKFLGKGHYKLIDKKSTKSKQVNSNEIYDV
jgi:predicted helicase